MDSWKKKLQQPIFISENSLFKKLNSFTDFNARFNVILPIL